MAILLHARTERRVALSPNTLVGRSPACHVCVRESVVSSEHASLRWRGDAWWLRDLGSRNGTWVDGRRITAGEEARLVVASTLAFGAEGDLWVVEDAGEPGALARCLDRDALALAAGSVLMLPDSEQPEVALVQQPHGPWLLDDGSGSAVSDGQIVHVGAERWKVHLPHIIEPTADARPKEVQLGFRVSMDEEYVEIEVRHDGQCTRLRPRSFNYLLLTLARRRLADADLPLTARGWVDQVDLARELRVEHRTVNVQLYRARQALGRVREDLATRLVQRRPRASQIRFGLDDVVVERI